MKRTIFGLCLALALAACGQDGANTNDRSTMGPKDRESAAAGASTSQSGASAGQSQSGVQPSGAPQPGQNPTQQQVDPKQPEQHRDFRHPNEGAGPQNPYGK